jgi:hypothetical protein
VRLGLSVGMGVFEPQCASVKLLSLVRAIIEVEADALVFAAGRNTHSLSARMSSFHRGLRAWRAYNSAAYIPGRSDILRHVKVSGRSNQRLSNGVRFKGISEVGLSHSSVEAYESTWSEGDNKSAKSQSKAYLTQRGR